MFVILFSVVQLWVCCLFPIHISAVPLHYSTPEHLRVLNTPSGTESRISTRFLDQMPAIQPADQNRQINI